MKAIEVLFLKIDELNKELKQAEDLDDKYLYAELIGDVVNAIKNLGRFRHLSCSNEVTDYL